MNLIDYLPDALRNVREYYYITLAGQVAFDAPDGAFDAVNRLVKNFFVLEADEATIERWENMLYITNVPANLETRRWNVLETLYGQRFFTLRGLRARIDRLLGMSGTSHTYVIYENYVLFVKYLVPDGGPNLAPDNGLLAEIYAWLRVIIPANLVLQVSVKNTHLYLKSMRFTHAFLHGYTHQQIREEILT